MKNTENRILILIMIFVTIGLLIWGRFFYLSVIRHNYYLTKSQMPNTANAVAPRGSIFLTDKDSIPYAVALNKEFPFVYASPIKIKDASSTAQILAPILNMSTSELFLKLSKINDSYEVLKRKVSDDVISAVKATKIEGIGTDTETLRYYPAGAFLSQVVGFLGFNKNGQIGQYGLEEIYDKELSGPINGSDLILTIDSSIQEKAGQILEQLMKDWNADGGSVIVMNPKNGDIIAMASLPEFDANDYSNVESKDIFKNPATLNLYEPGSVFKPLTMAIGIETGAVTPETQYYNTGYVVINGRKVQNSLPTKVLGWQTMTKVLEQSLNTGAIFVEQKVPKDVFFKYLKDFGINSKTGIDVPEATGNLSQLSTGRDINYATTSYGQGVALTPIELIRALAAIANGGKLIKPHLVRSIISHSGDSQTFSEDVPEQIISPETSAKLINMMVQVVENGSGRRAQVSGYTIAGKTGTAQVPDLKNGGYKDESIHTFVAFAPAYDPKFIVLIKLDNPKGVRFAESTVVPVFSDLAKFIFSYYQIPPDKPQ